MKKTLLIMVMALAVLLTQCRKPEVKFPSPVAPEGTTVSMTVTAGPGSKTDITTAGGITWSTGDKLYVGDGTKCVGYLTIVSGVGTPTGTFSGDVTLTGITEGDEKTFHFFYLGSGDYTSLTKGSSTSVDVDFSSQNIYNNGGKLENASAQHVGYGSASGTVKDGIVTGINVTLVSKVALARFSFKKGDAAYDGALTLSGDGIYNKMTVNFASSTGFSFSGTEGPISLTGSHSERYVMLVPPADVAAETLNFDGGAGTTILENGIEANKFYGKNEAIPVTINAYVDLGLSVKWATCNLGAEHPYDYGDYYAWGATETWYSAGGQSESPTWKSGYSGGYSWANCPFTNGTYSGSNKKVFTKYIPEGMLGYWAGEDDPDNKLVLESSDDAAAAAWGDGWRMPTSAECQELWDNNTFKWLEAGVTDNETGFKAVAAGYLVVKGGKNSIASDASVYMFLPAAGFRWNTDILLVDSWGLYWSSSLYTDEEPNRAIDMNFGDGFGGTGSENRPGGFSVRPVR